MEDCFRAEIQLKSILAVLTSFPDHLLLPLSTLLKPESRPPYWPGNSSWSERLHREKRKKKTINATMNTFFYWYTSLLLQVVPVIHINTAFLFSFDTTNNSISKQGWKSSSVLFNAPLRTWQSKNNTSTMQYTQTQASCPFKKWMSEKTWIHARRLCDP